MRLRDNVIKRGADLDLIIIPDAVQLNSIEFQNINRRVSAIASKLGIGVLDMISILEKVEAPASLYLFPHDAHLSELGTNIVAEDVSNLLILNK